MTQTRTLQERIEQILGETDNPLTSVVILSFNRPDDLEGNIRSLYERTNLPFEVVIWDNKSDPGTAGYVRSIDGMTNGKGNGLVRAFFSDKNLGCSGGRLEAVKQASGNWIYTVDNDMTYSPGWLEAIIARVEQDPQIGGANSKIIYPNGQVQLNGGRLHLEEGYFGSFLEVDAGKDAFSPGLTGEIDCDWLCGGATLVKREVAEQVRHDPEFLNGFEDYDYSLQIKGSGYRVVNCPESMVIHHHIRFDKSKQEREQSYIRDRRNSRRLWVSMVRFLETTGINMVKTSPYFSWIGRDGTKPFLEWGQIGDVQFEYEDLFPGRPFSKMTNQEIRGQFDSIIATNQEIRRYIAEGHNLAPVHSSKDIIEPLAPYFVGAFSRYNLANLAGHLDWVINSRFKGKGRLQEPDVNCLLAEVQKNVVVADIPRAQVVYDKLREGYSRLSV